MWGDALGYTSVIRFGALWVMTVAMSRKVGHLQQYLTKVRSITRSDPKQHHGKEEEEEGRLKNSVYFFLLNRLKRFSLSFSRLPGLDSAVAVAATVAGSVWARAAGAGVLWLLGVTSGFSPDTAAVMVEIHVFISSWSTSRRRQRGRKQLEQQEVLMMSLIEKQQLANNVESPPATPAHLLQGYRWF